MNQEQDDYQSDIRFGEWLRCQRVRVGLSVEKAAEASAMAVQRLKTLEMGLSERGITHAESVRICSVYRISLNELIEQASKA